MDVKLLTVGAWIVRIAVVSILVGSAAHSVGLVYGALANYLNALPAGVQ